MKPTPKQQLIDLSRRIGRLEGLIMRYRLKYGNSEACRQVVTALRLRAEELESERRELMESKRRAW